MNILIAGQKWFGAEVFRALRALPGVSIKAVCAPTGGDKLAGQANLYGVPVIASGTLNAASMPAGIDLIVAAHSHDFIGQATRLRARFGGIGYHPSLLPVHRGRDAIRWAIRMNERVTGGTVYRLSNRMDGGNIIDQRHIFIRPGDDARELWRRELAPLGVAMLTAAVARFAAAGFVNGAEQDETLATWEPSIDRQPAFRPDLLMLPAPRRHPWYDAEFNDDIADVIAAERGRFSTVNRKK